MHLLLCLDAPLWHCIGILVCILEAKLEVEEKRYEMVQLGVAVRQEKLFNFKLSAGTKAISAKIINNINEGSSAK